MGLICRCGEIGIHVRFRTVCREAWRFESSHRHNYMRNNNDYQIVWVGLLCVIERKILMTREKGSNLFQLPGGGQERGESLRKTLNREIMEEIGVCVKSPKLFDKFILPGRHEGVMIKFVIYQGEMVGDIVRGLEIEEIKLVDSKYALLGLDIGNPAKLKLIPKLLSQGLID